MEEWLMVVVAGFVVTTALFLLAIAAGGWLVGVALGSVLGTLLHIIFAIVAAVILISLFTKIKLPMIGTVGIKPGSKQWYLSLGMAVLFLFLALPNNGIFSITGSPIVDMPAAVFSISTVWELMAAWGIIILIASMVIKKIRR